MKKAIFLDRDVIVNQKACNETGGLFKKACDAGYELFMVTNREPNTKSDTDGDIEEKLIHHCDIKEIVYSPYNNKKTAYRDSESRMIFELADMYNLDLKYSWMVSDKEDAVTTGVNSGCRTGKIRNSDIRADVQGKDLLDVIGRILNKDQCLG
jgi:D-glycero-D-manno-heptose 1,7-bisphosphate phosphatase